MSKPSFEVYSSESTPNNLFLSPASLFQLNHSTPFMVTNPYTHLAQNKRLESSHSHIKKTENGKSSIKISGEFKELVPKDINNTSLTGGGGGIQSENFSEAISVTANDSFKATNDNKLQLTEPSFLNFGGPISSDIKKHIADDSSPVSNYSYSTITSPVLSDHYVYSENIVSKRAYQRQKLIEELIETEENYLDSLILLSTSYIKPLLAANEKSVCSPMVYGEKYVEILIENHSSFLDQLKTLFTNAAKTTKSYYGHDGGITSSQLRFVSNLLNSPSLILSPGSAASNTTSSKEEENRRYISTSDPLITKKFSDLIVKNAVCTYIYEEYCLIYDQVLELLGPSNENKNVFTDDKLDCWADGCARFIESAQIAGQKMDLSFISLFQKPIARIPKYKLLLDSLLKTIIPEEDQQTYNAVSLNLEDLKRQLDQLNSNVNSRQVVIKKTNLLFNFLNSCDANNLALNQRFRENNEQDHRHFPFHIFGNVILCGGLECIWVVSNKAIESQYLGCFLFKSHLILSTCSKANSWEIKFIIPLAGCKIVPYAKSNGDGLTSNYEFSFKLVFEDRYSLYEVAFFAVNERETTEWITQLDILINYVNGPYKFDYSFSDWQKDIRSMTKYPNNLIPVDVSLDKLVSSKIGSFRNNFNNCYFEELIPIRIQHFSTLKYYEDDNDTWRDKEEVNTVPVFNCVSHMVKIKSSERLAVELKLENIWSKEELPFLLSERKIGSNHGTIRRRKSKYGNEKQRLDSDSSMTLVSSYDLKNDDKNNNRIKSARLKTDSTEFNTDDDNNSKVLKRKNSGPNLIKRTSSVINGLFRTKTKNSR
ncbi:hypothetical protein PACTADRAFT_79233 [Pachysolen tannophilus NRRL Y-2460]|uniref:DH domain-containing protein n=1 Tax=Pachysolen tannophilus NRRL Y-2460 TaxID=669874 RepID=A0A1E4TYH1_PACTA|nr:hypothetical protein PACTADRAFT_79233 [Pachysolen tannophilus NRRL Y-2460]